MKIYKNKDIIERKIDDEIIIFVPINDSIVNMDAVGTKLWELIDECSEFEEVVKRFYDCFEEKPPYEQFSSEVDDVLSSFVRAGLLQYTEEK